MSDLTRDRTKRRRSHYFTTVLFVFGVVLVINLVMDPGLVRPSALSDTFATLAPFVLVALASTPSILSGGGGIDISIAPLMTFVNVVLVTQLMPAPGLLGTPWAAVALAVCLGAGVGFINGMLITKFRHQPILATLCGVFVLSGLALKLAPTPVPMQEQWPHHFTGSVLGVPVGLLLIALPLVAWIALSQTAWKTNLYAVGGDEVAAYSAGVPVASVRVLAYGLGGAIAGVGGIALTALLGSADASLSSQYILFAITAVALGGTSLAGGRGGLTGSLLGACTIYLVQNALTTTGISSAWLNVVYGGVLLFAIIIAGGLPSKREVMA